MPEISETLDASDRLHWRHWLAGHGASAREIWVLIRRARDASGVVYLDAVEEALCFGWIDGIAKQTTDGRLAQRFSPRARRSHWTELNKARARRLLRLGLMSEAGIAVLPSLDAPFQIPEAIEAALRATPDAWEAFRTFPELYRRVRVSYVDEVRRNADEFARRLQRLVDQTAAGRMFGNWNDGGRLTDADLQDPRTSRA